MRLRLSENGDLSRAATELIKLALDEGSVDNVSVVLVWFQDKHLGGAGGGGGGGGLQTYPEAPDSSATTTPSASRPHVPPD